jgi:hypothetical protein
LRPEKVIVLRDCSASTSLGRVMADKVTVVDGINIVKSPKYLDEKLKLLFMKQGIQVSLKCLRGYKCLS